MNASVKVTFYDASGKVIDWAHLDCYKCQSICDMLNIPPATKMLRLCFSTEYSRCAKCTNSATTEFTTDCEMDEVSSFTQSMDSEIIDILDCDLPTLQKRADFVEFYLESARLQTFDGWPKTLKQTPEQLSAAGFFYTQKDDRVICFCCGGGLHAWQEQDDPWEQHALHHDACEYLQSVKGSEYIAAIKAKFNNNAIV